MYSFWKVRIHEFQSFSIFYNIRSYFICLVIPVMNKMGKRNLYLIFLLLFAGLEFIKYVFSDPTPFVPFKTLFFSF
jgi:hypothetical protein